MSQIEELQSRLTSAMDRIGAGLEALSAAAPEAEAPQPGLAEALEEEKLANAQLQERLKAIKGKHEAELAELKSAHDAALEALKSAHAEEAEALKAAAADTAELDRLRADLEAQNEAMARLDMDVQRLRQSNDQLRASNEALRQANEEGVGDPHLINKAMLSELESLRAARATDAAEAGTVLARLEPLLARAANLPEGEDE